MSARRRQLAATLAGTVAIASGANAAGSAPAAKAAPKTPRGAVSKARSSAVAARLGVSDHRLRRAFEEARAEQHRPDTGQAADLATVLGRPAPEVEGALARFRREREVGLARSLPAGLADAFGLSQAAAAQALRSVGDLSRTRAEAEYGRFTAALARKLGVSVGSVRAALPAPPG